MVKNILDVNRWKWY